jgi:hypothetical protein
VWIDTKSACESRSSSSRRTAPVSDASEPDDADRLVVHVLAEHHQRTPDPRGAGAQESLALAHPPGGGHEQREGRVGGRLGEHVGRVRREHAGLGARGDVDVVEPDGVVRHDAQLRARGREELGVDLLGQHRHDRVAPGDHLQQLVAWDAELVLVHRHVAALLEPGQGGIHDGAGHQHVRSIGHGGSSVRSVRGTRGKLRSMPPPASPAVAAARDPR